MCTSLFDCHNLWSSGPCGTHGLPSATCTDFSSSTDTFSAPAYGAPKPCDADRWDSTWLFPFKFNLHLLHLDPQPPPNVALNLSGGNNSSPILERHPWPFLVDTLRVIRLLIAPSPWLDFSASMLQPERRASIKDVAPPSEVCSHSHSCSLLIVFTVVATVGSGGCYLFNNVAFSSEVGFHRVHHSQFSLLWPLWVLGAVISSNRRRHLPSISSTHNTDTFPSPCHGHGNFQDNFL